jgi:MoaA/NifB/PqqE/SkfB family radical SAM enzyme
MPPSVRWFQKRLYDGVNHRLRTFAGGRLACLCRPTSIAILMTERCNARCVHCDIWKNRGGEPGPDAAVWKRVFTDLRRWLGPVQVYITGGEALLRPYTPEVVAHAASLGLFVELLSHGYWLDQSRIGKLALANPWRITISLDAVSETHSLVRGRPDFFKTTMTSIDTLRRLRLERMFGYEIRLKTVLMEQNYREAPEVARFATQDGMHVFYQPIEQNYNTPEDPAWFTHSANWPRDTEAAVGVVEELIRLKREGLHIGNSFAQLKAMIPYFRDPASLRVAVQSHRAHEGRMVCSGIDNLQIHANGDVKTCLTQPPAGNICREPIRSIWENRPRWWQNGCCLEKRLKAEA